MSTIVDKIINNSVDTDILDNNIPLVSNVGIKLVVAANISIRYTDNSIIDFMVVQGNIIEVRYIKDGKLKKSIGKVTDILENAITIDCSEAFNSRTERIVVNNIRYIGHPIDPLGSN
ncbi:MAG: hypothetical protein ACRCXT_18270 [Paraclostridium sp.]